MTNNFATGALTGCPDVFNINLIYKPTIFSFLKHKCYNSFYEKEKVRSDFAVKKV